MKNLSYSLALKRGALLLASLGAMAGVAAAIQGASPEALDPLDPLARKAAMVPSAPASVLIAAARVGERVFVAGENGILLFSDDGGARWQQASVPVSVTLTAVHFANAQKGWAVGHSGVVLATADAGRTWVRQLDGRQIGDLPQEASAADAESSPAPNPGDPLLDVLFLDENEGFALGAFGLLLHTADGGAHWTRASSRLPNPDGNHLYGIRLIGDRLYVVGERGAVFASNDRGARFEALKTPYDGSYFGVVGNPQGELVVFGLQGRAFASADHGRTWADVSGGADSAWTGAATLADGRMVMVGQAGEVRMQAGVSDRIDLLQGKQPPLSAVVALDPQRLVTVGPRGVRVIQLASAANRSEQP